MTVARNPENVADTESDEVRAAEDDVRVAETVPAEPISEGTGDSPQGPWGKDGNTVNGIRDNAVRPAGPWGKDDAPVTS